MGCKFHWNRARKIEAIETTRPCPRDRIQDLRHATPIMRAELPRHRGQTKSKLLDKLRFQRIGAQWVAYAYDEQAARRLLRQLEQAGWHPKVTSLGQIPHPDRIQDGSVGEIKGVTGTG